jgi:hypothetical protein
MCPAAEDKKAAESGSTSAALLRLVLRFAFRDSQRVPESTGLTATRYMLIAIRRSTD